MISYKRYQEIRGIIQKLREGELFLDDARYALLDLLDVLKEHGLVATSPKGEEEWPHDQEYYIEQNRRALDAMTEEEVEELYSQVMGDVDEEESKPKKRPEVDVPTPKVDIRTNGGRLVKRVGGHQPTKKKECKPPRIKTVVHESFNDEISYKAKFDIAERKVKKILSQPIDPATAINQYQSLFPEYGTRLYQDILTKLMTEGTLSLTDDMELHYKEKK